MLMQLKPYKVEDYQEVSEWFQKHGWPPVQADILPALGAIVYDKETNKNLAVAWLYIEATRPVAVLEWMLTNPDNSPKNSYKAIVILVEYIKKLVTDMRYKVLFTSTKTEGLIKLYEKAGLQKADTGMTNFVYMTGV